MQVNATPILSLPRSGAIGPYLRVKLVSGVLVVAGAQDRELGTAKERIIASGLGTTDLAPVLHRRAAGTALMIADGAITQYAKVYGADAGKISATANGNYIGIALAAATADGDAIEVLRLDPEDGLLYVQTAASTAVTATDQETAFDKSYTIPAGALRVGDVIRIRAQVIATATNSTDTLNVKLKIGTTTLAATGAVDVANDDVAVVDVTLVVRTIGATGTFIAFGHAGLGVAGTATQKNVFLGSTAIDTTAAQAVTVSATWSSTDAGNSCRLDALTIERRAA